MVTPRRASVAIGCTILVMAYHVVQRQASHRELGGDGFDRRPMERQRHRLTRQLEALGLKVTIEEAGRAAQPTHLNDFRSRR